MADFNTL